MRRRLQCAFACLPKREQKAGESTEGREGLTRTNSTNVASHGVECGHVSSWIGPVRGFRTKSTRRRQAIVPAQSSAQVHVSDRRLISGKICCLCWPSRNLMDVHAIRNNVSSKRPSTPAGSEFCFRTSLVIS